MINKSNKLISIIFYGSKLTSILEDRFFKRKLYRGLIDLTESYISFNVAQSRSKETYSKFKNCLFDFIEILDYIEHSNNELQSPLLQLKRRAIVLNLLVIKDFKKQHDAHYQREASKFFDIDKLNFSKSAPFEDNSSKRWSTSSKDKILDFIRKTKKTRTRDLIEQFSAFSERTVKRTLKELTDNGILKREEDEKAVYYSILN